MGGSFDALTSRGQQQAPGRYSGTAVPHVAGPGPTSYTQPQNWANPAVSGRDLIVHRDVLRQVASDLAQMAGLLQTTLSACAQAAAPVAGAAGSWPQAQQLARAMTRAHTGVTQFTGQLTQAHHDMAARLTMSADRYDAAEHQITSLIRAATDPSATIVGSGGQDTPVQPGYGQNWTPQQRAAYYRIQRLENMPGNGGPSWTATYPITEDAAYAQGSSSGYTWQQVNSLLAATDPGAISAAGAAYGKLSSTLTEIAGQLASHGQTLAANWGGSTAVTAVSQVQQLHQTATDMQANTWAAQQALQWYGPVLAAFRASLPKPASTHPADVTAANQAAQQRMAALNSHIETAYYQMPGAVNKNLPPALAGAGAGPAGAGTATRGGGYPGGGASGGAAAGTGHSGGVLPGVAGGYPGGTGTGHPGGAGVTFPSVPGSQPPGGTTQLAGLPRGGPGGTAAGFPGAGPGGGATGGTGPGLTGLGGAGTAGTGPGGTGPVGFGALPPPSGGTGPGPGRLPGRTPADPAPGEAGAAGEPGAAEEGAGMPPGAFRNPALSEPAAGEGGSLAGQSSPGLLDVNGNAGEGLASAGNAGDAGVGDAARLPGTFPVTGAGAGGPGEDGAGPGRQLWGAEDEATWGPEVMPAAITGADGEIAGPDAEYGGAGMGWLTPGGRTAGGQQRDRARLAWLGEEDDFWGTGEPAAPPVIGG